MVRFSSGIEREKYIVILKFDVRIGSCFQIFSANSSADQSVFCKL